MPTPMAAKGAVGEPANSCILQATNDSSEAKRVVVHVTAANLCRSHAAYASLLVDGDPRCSRVDLNDSRMRIDSEVLPGQNAVLIVQLVNLHNGIACFRLGETEFDLELTPLE